MTNLEDATEGGYTAHSPEEFEEWCNSLSPAEQKAYLDRLRSLSGPVEYITTDHDMTERLDAAIASAESVTVYKVGDIVRIIAEDDSEYGRELPITGMSGEHSIWITVGVGMDWRYRPDEIEPVTKNA